MKGKEKSFPLASFESQLISIFLRFVVFDRRWTKMEYYRDKKILSHVTRRKPKLRDDIRDSVHPRDGKRKV